MEDWVKITIVVALCLTQLTQAASDLDGVDWLKSWFKSDEKVEAKRSKRQAAEDESPYYYEVVSTVLPRVGNERDAPVDFRQLPTLGNGHIGMVPYRGYIYMNGLYNGQGGKSHRAKIPAVNVGKIYLGNDTMESSAIRRFTMNARDGYFKENIKCDFGEIEHIMYPHQYYTRLLVVQINAKGNNDSLGGGTLYLNYPSQNSTEDITFSSPSDYWGFWYSNGRTKSSEAGENTQSLVVFYKDALAQVKVNPNQVVNYTFLMAVDYQEASARTDFFKALEITYEENGDWKLFDQHIQAWRNVWGRGMVTVEGDREVEKLVFFSQYYILSNFPALNPFQPMSRSQYVYGSGRQSLAWGEEGKDYQGHIFWDNEMYVLPALLPMHPDLVKEMLRYRAEKRGKAEEDAQKHGDEGMRFPWESARSGADVTPEGTCDHCRDRQIFVGGAVSFAIRQYFSLTWDLEYLNNEDYRACDLTRDISKFYASKARFNYSDGEGRYEITDVVGPDDRADHVNNNAFINTLASLSIHWARYMACRCKRIADVEVPEDDYLKALYMRLPFDNRRRVHYQFDNFEEYLQKNESYRVKQADTLLMGYPLNWNMSRDIWKNDLNYYKNLIDVDTPAMTYSFMTVGWKFIEDKIEADNYFQMSYENYVIQPFKIWREYSSRQAGEQAVNFLPGMGGFLQSVIYGFLGMRIRPEQLEFHAPTPPTRCTNVTISGLNYLNANLSLFVEYTGTSGTRARLTVHDIDSEYPLVLVRNNTNGKGPEESLNPGEEIIIENANLGFYIYTNRGTPCEHPRDYIYMPCGYSSDVDLTNSSDVDQANCSDVGQATSSDVDQTTSSEVDQTTSFDFGPVNSCYVMTNSMVHYLARSAIIFIILII